MTPLVYDNFLAREKTVRMRGPLAFTIVFTYQKSFTLGPADLAGVPEKKTLELKRTRFACNAIVCETSEVSDENSIFPIFQKHVTPGHFSSKRKKKKHLLRREKCKVNVVSRIQGFCGMRYLFWSAMISEYVW